MNYILSWRYSVVAFAVSLIILITGLYDGGIIKYDVFPDVDTDFIIVNAELPVGTPAAETVKVTHKLQEGWKKTEDFYKEQLGNKSLTVALFSVAGGNMGRRSSGNHLTSVFVEMLPTENRNIPYKEILDKWREFTGTIDDALSVSYEGFMGGPESAGIAFDLSGTDPAALQKASLDLQNHMKTFAALSEVQSTFKVGKRELKVSLKPSARSLGLTLQDLALQLRQGFYGSEVTRIQRGNDEVKIMVRYPEKDRKSLTVFNNIKIRTPNGTEVPFYQVAEYTMQSGYNSISREKGKRLITVSASVSNNSNDKEIENNIIDNYLPKIEEKYSISASAGSASKENSRTLESIGRGFIIALLVIYLIMATVFKSYVQPAIIILTIPFGMIGAVIGHLIFQMPISTMTLFGMIALAGIVVNDSIVLIESVNNRLSEGMTLFNALKEGGKRRFRAIILTTLTTFAGLFPIIMEKSLQAQILIPMAVAIAFGVAFATFSTLVIVPCFLAIINDIKMYIHFLRYSKFTSREALEPRAKISIQRNTWH